MGRKGRKVLLAVLLVACVGASAAVAGVTPPQQFSLLGPEGNAWCDGSGVISGTASNYGSAVIAATPNGTAAYRGSVATNVVLNHQQPNTRYEIRLIQGSNDCHSVDTTVMTDASGNATVRWVEPNVSTHAFVAVDPQGGGAYFVTTTYYHQ